MRNKSVWHSYFEVGVAVATDIMIPLFSYKLIQRLENLTDVYIFSLKFSEIINKLPTFMKSTLKIKA